MAVTVLPALHAFILAQIAERSAAEAKILDFGCGSGRLVHAGRARGIDMIGADVFYGGANDLPTVRANLGRTLFAYHDRLPFDDNSFDMVVSNQVFEHVVDMAAALAEIRRVLRPGGQFLTLFPTIGVIREGHCGVPMAHWLNHFPSTQRAYLTLMHAAGLGYHRGGKTRGDWAVDFSEWLRTFTVYRSRRQVDALHAAQFTASISIEPAMIADRCERRGLPSAWTRTTPGRWLATLAARRLATAAIVLS